MEQESAATRIQRRLADEFGWSIQVEEHGDAFHLMGSIDSADVAVTIQQVVLAMAHGKGVENYLIIERATPDDVLRPDGELSHANDTNDGIAMIEARTDLSQVFFAQPLDANATDVSDVSEADTVYFPPTDPVVKADDHGNLQVVGGWTQTTMTSDEVDPSVEGSREGDGAIADAIVRALAEDAATTDLNVDVLVRDGVAYLRGTVRDMQDVENAEEVAARFPGVIDVVEELTVPGVS
ncbi:MAG: hypothetical protein NVSMB52_13070 [Chloroflexota bacterium]